MLMCKNHNKCFSVKGVNLNVVDDIILVHEHFEIHCFEKKYWKMAFIVK